MSMKKKLPLDLIKGFHPKLGDSIKVEVDPSNQKIAIFRDKDPESDFYFEIGHFNSTGDKIRVNVKPSGRASVNSVSHWLTIQELNNHFTNWIKIIDEYNSSETMFDDPIVKGFEEEFLKGVKFVDLDGDKTKPFSPDIILKLDAHLENIENKIDDFKDNKNEKEIGVIKSLTIELRADLTNKPKGYVRNTLIKIWSKIAKQGPKLIKEFLTEGGKLAVKETIKFLFSKGAELLS